MVADRAVTGAFRPGSTPGKVVLAGTLAHRDGRPVPSSSEGMWGDDLAAHCVRALLSNCLPPNRGRREDRVLAAPAVPCAILRKQKHAHEHTGQREHSGLPCAMALRLTSCSSRRTALLPPSSTGHFPPT